MQIQPCKKPGPHKIQTLIALRKIAWSAVIAISLFSLCATGAASDESCDEAPPKLEVIGHSKLSANLARQWMAQIVRRHRTISADGYTPNAMKYPGGGDPLPTEWELPVEFHWNFGDGSATVITGERTTAGHLYKKNGTYTITVEARNREGQTVVGSKTVTVTNRPPRVSSPTAVEIDSATATFELATEVDDAPDDILTIHWDFGDDAPFEATGRWDENPAWQVEHAFPLAGTYQVTVTVTDDEGLSSQKSREIISLGASDQASEPVGAADESAAQAEPSTLLSAEFSGSITTPFSGLIRSVAGIHLAPVSKGNKCRFMLTAWDDSKLAQIGLILDLAGLPGEEGATYSFHPGGVDVNFYPTAEAYAFGQRGLRQGFASAPLNEQVADLTAGLSDAVHSELTDIIGLDTSEQEGATETAPSIAPAFSPFSLEGQESYRAQSGRVELTFIPYDRAIASLNLELTNTDPRSPLQLLSLKGSFNLALEEARREGMMLYEQCSPAEFAIEETYPEQDRQHFYLQGSRVSVNFTDRYDVNTLNESTFQLTYPAAGTGEPVPVAARIHRLSSLAVLIPEKDLLGGVRYTARIRTGKEGVRGQNGAALEDEDGGWHTWDFTTRVNVIPEAGVNQNLSCHVFQSVRDAPLIAGKPAVSRIYADWEKHPQVDWEAQINEFTARVVVRTVVDGQFEESGSEFHTFVRPKMQESAGVDRAQAEHTANVFWTPQRSTPGWMMVALEVPQAPGESHADAYWTNCATPMWDLEPELTIEYNLLAINDWADEATLQEYVPVVRDMMMTAEVYAEQQFPFKHVYTEQGPVLRLPEDSGFCDETCAKDVVKNHASESSADIVIGLMPLNQGRAGGQTYSNYRNGDGAGYITLTIGKEPANRDRWINGIVHEFGHTLWLWHLPSSEEEVADMERDNLLSIRDDAWRNDGTPKHWYQGIEGFRIARDGKSGFSKSSIEGNAEGKWLTPLMFPGTIPYTEAFILRHQYLRIQEQLSCTASGGGDSSN